MESWDLGGHQAAPVATVAVALRHLFPRIATATATTSAPAARLVIADRRFSRHGRVSRRWSRHRQPFCGPCCELSSQYAPSSSACTTLGSASRSTPPAMPPRPVSDASVFRRNPIGTLWCLGIRRLGATWKWPEDSHGGVALSRRPSAGMCRTRTGAVPASAVSRRGTPVSLRRSDGASAVSGAAEAHQGTAATWRPRTSSQGPCQNWTSAGGRAGRSSSARFLWSGAARHRRQRW